jgi:tRNA threonylcarbamoyladenosine biosynthesis protein TsaE
VLALDGDLGTGKTQLVKGFARGLGLKDRVHSPTFSLVNIYVGGRLPIYHLDLYRLNTPEQIIGAGLSDYLAGSDGVTIVEWAEKWFGKEVPLPRSGLFRRVKLEAAGESQRRIEYDDISP